jgi:hypothetical protein
VSTVLSMASFFFFFNTVAENWLTVATDLHSVKHRRHPAVPFTTLWFPAHVGYTGKHKDTCMLSHTYKVIHFKRI